MYELSYSPRLWNWLNLVEIVFFPMLKTDSLSLRAVCIGCADGWGYRPVFIVPATLVHCLFCDGDFLDCYFSFLSCFRVNVLRWIRNEFSIGYQKPWRLMLEEELERIWAKSDDRVWSWSALKLFLGGQKCKTWWKIENFSKISEII